MARREAHAFAGDEIDERIAGRGSRGSHRLHHALERLRAGDCRDVRESVADRVRRGPHAASHDHLAILIHRLADGRERFRFGAVEKAAGVDDDRSAGMAARARSLARRRGDAFVDSAAGQPSETKRYVARARIRRGDGVRAATYPGGSRGEAESFAPSHWRGLLPVRLGGCSRRLKRMVLTGKKSLPSASIRQAVKPKISCGDESRRGVPDLAKLH